MNAQSSKIVLICFLLNAAEFVVSISEEDEGVKYADKCEGIVEFNEFWFLSKKF